MLDSVKCRLLFVNRSIVDCCRFIVVGLMFNVYVYLTARRGALLGASGDQTALPFLYLLPGQTRSQLFGAFVVVLDALLLVSFRPSFFDDVFSFL